MTSVLSILLGVSASTTIGIILSELFGSLTLPITIISLITGFSAGVASFYFFRKRLEPFQFFSYWGWLMAVLFITVTFDHFQWELFVRYGIMCVSDDSNYVDLPNHIMYVNYFAGGAHFWPSNPFIDIPLTYPFGMDFFTAYLAKFHLSPYVYLPFLGYVFSLLLMVTLYIWGGPFTAAAFLFSGGGYNYLYFFTGILKDYQSARPWCNLLPLFSSQRGYLYAFPAGLALLWSWRNRFFPKNKKSKPLPQPIEGIIWGTMPFFHVHTFIFLSVTFGLWAFLTKKIKATLPTLWWAVPLATYEIFKVTNGFTAAHLLGIEIGWMIKKQNIFMFFWNNYGLYIPLALATLFFSFTNRDWWKQLLPGTLLFVICYFVTFAPYDWDNNKIMIWCYLAALPLMYEITLMRFRPKLRAFIIILLLLPGAVAIVARSSFIRQPILVYPAKDVEEVCKILEKIPIDSRIAIAPVHPHPVLICGHPVVESYNSFLWMLGIKWDETETMLRRFLTGDPEWKELSKKLNFRYVFWGPKERQFFFYSTRPWESGGADLVAQGSWGSLYKLNF